MFPYECTPDNEATAVDDGEYVYCDKESPNFDETGNIQSFNGKCADGRSITCDVNRFKNTTKVCTQPIYETEYSSEIKSTELQRNYEEKLVDVLSGEPDIYSGNENCLRSNTVEEAREQELYVKIVGSGSLDDDIYVLRHQADGGHQKVYCNMQHAESKGSRKPYNGEVLQCIDNNGSYSFNKTVPIDVTDIVSVQQNSENENATGAPFALGRNHYSSTKVTIDGIEVAPNTYPSTSPYYPSAGHLKTWDNTTSTFSILFPFAGAYEIYFYNKNNKEMGKASLDMEDFKQISLDGSIQLKMGTTMELATNIQEDIVNEDGTKILKANREDMWVEWGGGVYGGRETNTGQTSSVPNDTYVKNNAVYKVIVRDLLTGSVTPIPMVYPLPYANRIFISKLKVYEYRKYRCYDPFNEFNLLGETSETRYICSNTTQWQDYKNNFTNTVGDVQQWNTQDLCEQNCRTYNACTNQTRNGVNGYTCSQRGGEDIGGDIEGNFFSTQDSCDAQCWAQNTCEQYAQSSCNIVEEQLSEPISDFTGKTLYKKKSLAYKCETRQDVQTGCAEYDLVVTEGDVNYSLSTVGFESKDYSGEFEDAVTHAQMLEVGQQHIFSGWRGRCVYGLKWDFSYLSDPMTIMSYAMSVYSSTKWLAETGGVGWAQDAMAKFDSFTNTVGGYVDSAMNYVSGNQVNDLSGTVFEGYEAGANAGNVMSDMSGYNLMPDPTLSAGQNLADSFNNVNDFFAPLNIPDSANRTLGLLEQAQNAFNDFTGLGLDWDATVTVGDIEMKWGFVNITQGDLITMGMKTALNIAAPKEADYVLADKLLKGYAGVKTGDESVYNYNTCMASIGASLPNLVGWSAKSGEHSSSQLVMPWQHPLRMTAAQLSSIAVVTSENYVTSQFMMENTDEILINVIAITPEAYLKATQTICMGTKVAQAAAQIQHDEGDGGGMSGGDMAMMAAKMALSMVCPPCGFAATIIMDLATNVFAPIDTCTDEKDAMSWGMLDFKTQSFLKSDTCHHVTTVCDKEVNFGFTKKCVRHRNEYCCYDQITTKIFAEGLKEQLDKGWTLPGTFYPSCSDIDVDDLKDVSFRECRNGEIASINKCFPSDKYSEFQKTLFRQANKQFDGNVASGLVEQAINSMAISQD
jgi:hypothetical protein